MKLYQEWKNKMEEHQRSGTYDEFFQTYILRETEAYKDILDNRQKTLSGNVKDLASQYKMEPVIFAGFLDGIHSSLVSEIDLEEVEEDTELSVEIDYNKLYYNMLKVKADWLYTLPQWDSILSDDNKKEIRMKLHNDSHVTVQKIGRNDPCPCASGKKYKKCCGNA